MREESLNKISGADKNTCEIRLSANIFNLHLQSVFKKLFQEAGKTAPWKLFAKSCGLFHF
jgi:hypothetical protein